VRHSKTKSQPENKLQSCRLKFTLGDAEFTCAHTLLYNGESVFEEQRRGIILSRDRGRAAQERASAPACVAVVWSPTHCPPAKTISPPSTPLIEWLMLSRWLTVCYSQPLTQLCNMSAKER
jgi:hypothetical protein